MFIYAAKLSKDFRIQGVSDNIFQQDIHNLMFTKIHISDLCTLIIFFCRDKSLYRTPSKFLHINEHSIIFHRKTIVRKILKRGNKKEVTAMLSFTDKRITNK